MTEATKMIAFGPVPSRRLGHSLGINNIPPKVCTYTCVYCQLGRTMDMQVKRRTFYKPEDIFRDAKRKVEEAKEIGEPVGYLTFVPDGEPTLDINLGKEIELLKPLGIKIAVITNASLIWREDVREELVKAHWVSIKVDASRENIWRRINRPHPDLEFDSTLDGMLEFAKTYTGELASETMLVKDVNDSEDHMEELADFLEKLNPVKAYLSIPTRPPAEEWAQPPSERTINQAYQILSQRFDHVEYLIGYEGNAFAFTGNVEDDLLSITSVHPMREEAVQEYLTKAKANWGVIEKLLNEDRLVEVEYGGKKFYIRKLSKLRRGNTAHTIRTNTQVGES